MKFDKIYEYIFDWADKIPNHIALVYDYQQITYYMVRENSEKMAKWLLKHGIKKGDCVAYILYGCPDFFYLYLGASLIGVEVSGINIRCPLFEVGRFIDEIKPSLIICDDYRKDIINEYNNAIPLKEIDLDSTNDICFSLINKCEITEDDVVFKIYTSGTTGKPKGALLTHKSILSSVLSQIIEFGAPTGLVTSDVIQHHVPVNHVSGAVQWGVAPLVAGCTLIINKEFEPEQMLANMENYRVTIMTGVPTMWKMVFNIPYFNQVDLSSVRWCAIGAAPSSYELIKRILDICPICSNPLGMTESSGFCSHFGEKANIEDIVETVGSIIPTLQYKIIGDNDKPVSSNNVGRLAIKGDSIIKEYSNARLPLTQDGFFISGDLAYSDSRQMIHLCGRKDDMFLVGGYNVFPQEIENVIMQYPGIESAVVIPKPHYKMGNVCKALVTSDNGAKVDTKKLVAFLENRLVYYKIPRDIIQCEFLPVSALGKINRKEILKQNIT